MECGIEGVASSPKPRVPAIRRVLRESGDRGQSAAARSQASERYEGCCGRVRDRGQSVAARSHGMAEGVANVREAWAWMPKSPVALEHALSRSARSTGS